MQLVSVTASVGTSMAIALSRCVVVTRPLSHHQGEKRRFIAIVVIWVAAVVLSSVQFVVTRTTLFPVGPHLQASSYLLYL